MSPAESDNLNPLEAAFEAQTAAELRNARTPAGDLPSESENSTISTLPIQADANLLPVVGLGGSAGSIKALQSFFEAMPADSGMAFVVVLHLAPDFESQLTPVLQAHTEMPVVRVAERTQIQANHVYVIPPGKHLEMADGRIFLTPLENEFSRGVTVDLFFRSLAASQRSRAVAVVLSGLDSDGSIGIKRVKEHGGVTIAQDPDEAEHDGMPRSAIQTGMIDWVLPIARLAPRLVEFWENEKKIQLPPVEAPTALLLAPVPQNEVETLREVEETALREILAFVLARTGHDFAHYKRATILRRIGRRLQVNSLSNLPDYVTFLRTHGGETGALLQDLLISVTNFFRDPEAFYSLEIHIPLLFRGKRSGDQVRVWVAGCATGEEAYSVAMLLAEHAATLAAPPSIQVFATDIDEEATRAAREGRFPQAIAADVSPERLRRFFVLDHGHYRVRTELREIVLFATHNLLSDSPFSHLDMVTCRNLLIYFRPVAQERVFRLFHFALNAEGLLFLGGSETHDESEGIFLSLDKKNRIYARRPGSRRQSQFPTLPAPRAVALSPVTFPPSNPLVPRSGPRSTHFSQLEPDPQHLRERAVPDFGELHLKLLEQFSPPSVLVTREFDIVHLSERAGRFMQFRGGVVSTNLLSVVHPSLRLELRAALMSALQSGTSVDAPELPFELEGAPRIIDLRVRPLHEDESDTNANSGGGVNYLMVIFDDRERHSADTVLERSGEDAAVRRLESESGTMKVQLRSVVEQYEATTEELQASNEELQAMNEELRSAGEELESSKEELQAANEELITVNQEMKSKVEQLAYVNGVLQNLMAATTIATIFLDRELCIRRYTPASVALFKLIPSDIYRPLSDLRHSLRYESMNDDARSVLDTLQPIEREVEDDEGRWFIVRVVPYRTLEDRIDGVVFTFVDVTHRIVAETELRRSEERFRAIFEQANVGIVQTTIKGDLVAPNPGFCKIIGYAEAEAKALNLRDVTYPEDYEREITLTRQLIAGEIAGYSLEKRYIRKGGALVWGEMTATMMRDSNDTPMFALVVVEDISERRAAQDAVRESQERLQVLLDSVQDYAIITMTPENVIASWNSAAEKIFGWNESEIVGQPSEVLFTPEDRETGEVEKEIETARHEGRAADERWHLKKDGSRFYASGVMTALRDDARHGFIKILRDLTAQKESEEALRASEARFRTQSDAIPQIVWTNEPQGAANGFNKRWFDFSGLNFDESYGLGWQRIVHPEDDLPSTQRWLAALGTGEVFETEYRLRDRNGEYRWHIGRNVPLRDENHQVLGWFGTATDIQDLKDAQEALRQSRDSLEQRVEERTQTLQERTLALQEEVVERQRLENQARELMQRIVQVQEEERRRISRELHDNVGQHATAILLSLQLLQDSETNRPEGERRRSANQLVKLHNQMNELLGITHRLAWELRPAVLDNIGLEAALRQYVAEWLRHGVEAEFVSRLPENEAGRAEIGLSLDAETALYRVVQEALTNVMRHAGATMVSVVLERRAAYVTAIVEDNGRGFDPEAAPVSKRLGMRGMQERMELVGGTLEIESQPTMGTTIYARVPLDAAD